MNITKNALLLSYVNGDITDPRDCYLAGIADCVENLCPNPNIIIDLDALYDALGLSEEARALVSPVTHEGGAS